MRLMRVKREEKDSKRSRQSRVEVPDAMWACRAAETPRIFSHQSGQASFSPLQPPASQGGTSQGEGDPGDAVEKAGGSQTRCCALSAQACSSVCWVPSCSEESVLTAQSWRGPRGLSLGRGHTELGPGSAAQAFS